MRTYNDTKYLKKQLESIVNQIYPIYELTIKMIVPPTIRSKF
jgi:glycosyltransferase involved in cell wall biosynthesis